MVRCNELPIRAAFASIMTAIIKSVQTVVDSHKETNLEYTLDCACHTCATSPQAMVPSVANVSPTNSAMFNHKIRNIFAKFLLVPFKYVVMANSKDKWNLYPQVLMGR